MKEKFARRKVWHFGIQYVGCGFDFPPVRIDDFYLNGFFIGYWFIGWIR